MTEKINVWKLKNSNGKLNFRLHTDYERIYELNNGTKRSVWNTAQTEILNAEEILHIFHNKRTLVLGQKYI